MDKINILWIEDNPLQEALFVKDLIKRDSNLSKVFDKALYDYEIPAVHFEKELKDYHQYFNLQVLQHPVEIKDFVTMCLQLEDQKGTSAFNKMEVVLPEVIAFDYHFGAKIAVNQGAGALSYNPKIEAIRKFINPNFKFKDKEIFGKLFADKEFLLEKVESENYSQNDFLKEISKTNAVEEIKKKDKDDLIEDDFGLFSAIEILRIFREHTTVAIPATYNKNEVEKLTLHGKYFEWLNEYEYSVDFEREDRGNKKWDSILKDAVKALRKKIETHLKLGKIIVSYSHLNELSKKELSNERVFSFKSAYGNKSLPLDGLFIDVSEVNRVSKINEWALGLIKIYSSKNGFTFVEYEKAKAISKTLILQYQATDEIDKRDRLSELVVKLIIGDIQVPEKEELESLMGHFGITDAKIESFKNIEGAENSNLEKNYIDYRDKKTGKHELDRLIILFSDLRLHKIYEDFCARAGKGEKEFYLVNQLLDRPTYKELRCVLFPVAQNPLVLPHHELYLPKKYQKKDPFEVWDNHLTKNVMKEHHILPKTSYPANLSSTEKNLCLSFAKEIKLSENYFPYWVSK